LLFAALALAAFSSDVRAQEEEDRGTFSGTVIEKGKGWLRIQPAEGESQRFMARWIGGMPTDGGGLDKSMVKQIDEVPVGAQVRIDWIYEERQRVVELDVTKYPEKSAPDKKD